MPSTSVSILKDGAVYQAAITPIVYSACKTIPFIGVKVCAVVKIKTEGVFLCLRVNSWEHCIQIAGNGCAELGIPGIGLFKLKICASEFSDKGTQVCTKISVTACVDFFFYKKCINVLNRSFCIEKPDAVHKALSANTKIEPAMQLALLRFHEAMEEESCSCG